ncbi:hypothetical protein [Microcoleus sp. B7-D4]|uniref:hypothetical protein n=1 Tax=Microcoleus sp. B7-D4 TaxID=2818696 RepID=UPI002FD266FD
MPYIDFKRFVTVRVAVILPLWSFAVDRIILISVNIPQLWHFSWEAWGRRSHLFTSITLF